MRRYERSWRRGRGYGELDRNHARAIYTLAGLKREAFLRAVAALEAGRLAVARDGARDLLAYPSSRYPLFSWVPLLADGPTDPAQLPGEWRGQITCELVSQFFQLEYELYLRPPGWGARADIVRVDPERRYIEGAFPAKTPLVNPFREAAR